ncbi:hypothetical protein EVAR_103405_1 [Eumeta japonica]|uniref:Uncharacterized protein n=1 Tax=Eumeta variegata TaxID=151549 RepID=A0A4C1YV48_EUMVA|nr:hypothetical protein EVAR_103405_1 [Eumeta japonica]
MKDIGRFRAKNNYLKGTNSKKTPNIEKTGTLTIICLLEKFDKDDLAIDDGFSFIMTTPQHMPPDKQLNIWGNASTCAVKELQTESAKSGSFTIRRTRKLNYYEGKRSPPEGGARAAAARRPAPFPVRRARVRRRALFF